MHWLSGNSLISEFCVSGCKKCEDYLPKGKNVYWLLSRAPSTDMDPVFKGNWEAVRELRP